MIIREFKKEDQKEVKEFVLKILKEYRFCHRPEWDYDLEDPKLHYKENGGIFYVCESNNQIVGTIAIKNHGKGIAELKRLYLEETFRGKGIGEKLVDIAIVFCKKEKFTKIKLDTWIGMKAAQKLYQKKGFKIINEKGEQIFMEKKLIE